MFGVPETPYDSRFQLLGMPVRVHPLFWLVAAMLGWRNENMPVVMVWVGCVFVSILVHEYGHGLTARAFGASPSIVLQAFGGLCIYHADRQSPRQRLAVLLWGPGAGFVFCLATLIAFSAIFGMTADEHLAFVKWLLWMDYDQEIFGSGLMKLGYTRDPHALNTRFEIYMDLLQINIMWGLINLLPVWPLDGGQVTETVLTQVNPFHGRRWTHVISLVVAGLIAVLSYVLTKEFFRSLFFAYFAVINYQMLDTIHRTQSMGIYDDDWWRK